ncbi:TIGR02300 family protein [Pseudochelatococcus sp. B33]
MAKPELGTKRLCQGCGAKFYDLNRDPILCPKCGTPFQVSAGRPVAAASDVDDEEGALDSDVADIVSLDDVADQESVATKADDDDDIDLGEDIPDDDDDGAAFLADDDEENDDVSGLIDGDIDTDDEN